MTKISILLIFLLEVRSIDQTQTSTSAYHEIADFGRNNSQCMSLLLISFFTITSPSTKLPKYTRFWFESCRILRQNGLQCMLNLVTWYDDDDNRTVEEILPCPGKGKLTNATDDVIVKIWKKDEFYERLKSIGVDLLRRRHQFNKFIDFKPFFGALIELFLPSHNRNAKLVDTKANFQLPHCYSRWGRVDIDGTVGTRLMHEVALQQCHSSTTKSRSEPTPAIMYYGKGMWQQPIWSGQLATFCNTRSGR